MNFLSELKLLEWLKQKSGQPRIRKNLVKNNRPPLSPQIHVENILKQVIEQSKAKSYNSVETQIPCSPTTQYANTQLNAKAESYILS